MELSKKERRELRREEKKTGEFATKRAKKIKSFSIWLAIILILAGAGYLGYLYLSKVINIPEIGEPYSIEGANHVADGTRVEYKTNPPSSGNHYNTPANWGVYNHEIPDEAVVHNLEHGGIWISYQPTISKAEIKQLTDLAKSYSSKVILTPRAKNDSPIAIVSWGRIYKMDLFNEGAIRNFILKYKNTGPEFVPDNMPGKNY